jgi:hypothetical protein
MFDMFWGIDHFVNCVDCVDSIKYGEWHKWNWFMWFMLTFNVIGLGWLATYMILMIRGKQ